jgi:hypothetical protein
MIRRVKRVAVTNEDSRRVADEKLASFLHGQPPARRGGQRKRTTVPDVHVAMHDAERRASDADWTHVTGRVFVGLYALCHRVVYRVVPTELENPQLYAQACRQAELCYRRNFRDDPDACVEYVKWAWTRERGRRDWALSKGIDRNRLRPRQLFSQAFVDDYHVHLEGLRHRGQKARRA